LETKGGRESQMALATATPVNRSGAKSPPLLGLRGPCRGGRDRSQWRSERTWNPTVSEFCLVVAHQGTGAFIICMLSGPFFTAPREKSDGQGWQLHPNYAAGVRQSAEHKREHHVAVLAAPELYPEVT
jgi:hypothetical protein